METAITSYFKGRGAQVNPNNKFLKNQYSQEHIEGLDDGFLQKEKTEVIYTYPKTNINKVESTDIGLGYSLNPYQGCEHGCTRIPRVMNRQQVASVRRLVGRKDFDRRCW